MSPNVLPQHRTALLVAKVTCGEGCPTMPDLDINVPPSWSVHPELCVVVVRDEGAEGRDTCYG